MAVLCCWLRCAADCAACWLNGDGWLCAGLIAGCTNCWLYQLLAVPIAGCAVLVAGCAVLAAGCADWWLCTGLVTGSHGSGSARKHCM